MKALAKRIQKYAKDEVKAQHFRNNNTITIKYKEKPYSLVLDDRDGSFKRFSLDDLSEMPSVETINELIADIASIIIRFNSEKEKRYKNNN